MRTVAESARASSLGHTFFWPMALCILLFASCDEAETSEAGLSKTGGDMVTLSIDLQDGFVDDSIVLLVNSKEVYRREHINTKPVIGLAESVRTEVETGRVSIEVNVQTKDIAKTIVLEVSADTFVGISIVDGKLDYIVSRQPFTYG